MQGVGTGRLVASRYALRQRRATLGAIEVWAATDSTLGREVAVTVLPSADPKANALLDAARRSATVNDHRLVRVLDVGSRGEIAWVVEESLSESTSIADLLAGGPLPPEEARRIAGEVASALDVAARGGLHHQHVTPHAVRRTKAGIVKIAGLATAAAVEGTTIPDADEAQRVDALGVAALLYAAMTTRWPLRTPVPGLQAAPRIAGTIAAPSEIAVAVPPDLDALCRDAFGRTSSVRTPGELASRLGPWSHTLVRHVSPTPASAPPTEQIPRVRSDHAPTKTSTARTGAAAARMAGAGGAAGAASSAGAAPRGAAASGRTDGPRKPSHREQRAHEKAAQAAEARREIAARRRDPGFLDVPEALAASSGPLEPPAPLIAAPVEREGRYAKIILGVVGAAVLAATVLAIGSLSNAFDEMTSAVEPTPTTTPSPAAPATPGQPQQSPTEDATDEPREAIAFVGARALDPEGDGQENDRAVPRAYDGDTSTFWQSEGYRAADYQGTKSGVGIAFELPEGVEATEVSLVLAEQPQDLTVYASSNRSTEDATEVGSLEGATGSQTLDIPENARGERFLIVWVTSAAEREDGRFRAILTEVTAV
ncbi:MAG: protein kinase family protein [Mobilicoccus sp.]|nr:protein kinase family protein [Mobilicoccus sp.]